VSLAYLWECSQESVLHAMVGSGLEAVLIKVASMGLSSRHLGKPIGSLYSNFLSLVRLALADDARCHGR